MADGKWLKVSSYFKVFMPLVSVFVADHSLLYYTNNRGDYHEHVC